MTGLVSYSCEDGIADIVLRRPSKLNAFSDEMVSDLQDAFWRFDDDDDALVAILRGDGRAFSAGADVIERQLRPLEELKRLGGPEGRGTSGHGMLYRSVNWKPVVGVGHGYALGMGFGLLLDCDVSLVANDTVLQVTEMKRGLWSSYYWSKLHFRGIGSKADEVVFTGRSFTGSEAVDFGFLHFAMPADRVLGEAREIATNLRDTPVGSVRSMVRARRWYAEQYETPNSLLREAFPLHLSSDFRESAERFAQGLSKLGD